MADQYISHKKRAIAHVMNHIKRGLDRATIIVETSARRNVSPGGPSGFKTSRGSGGLRGSIGREVDMRSLRGFVGTNLRYGRIHELGGVINPKNSQWLTIPVTDEARKARGATYMDDLNFIPLSSEKALLARSDDNFELDVQFVLVKSVTIPARPYLRPALYKNKDKITKALTRPLPPVPGVN